jgi:DNA repair exonuclease SbcCD ATPase subunit
MRLEISSIRFRNFLSFGSKWQDVNFLHGINLVLGLDRDKDRSNASGKSSFLETIPFALFGKVNRNIRKEQIVNWKSRKNCEVQIDFAKGIDDYTIYRALKPDKLIVSRNGQDLPIDSKKIDFQRKLEDDILNIDFKTFMSLIYTNINSTVPILTMKKPEKRKFLERVFGLQFVKVINDNANRKVRNIDKKLGELSIQKEYNSRTASDAKEQIIDLERKLRSYSSSQPKLNELIEELKEVEDVVQEAEDNYNLRQGEIGILEGQIEYYNFLVARVGVKLASLGTKIKTLGKQIEPITGLDKDLSRLRELEKLKEKYIKLETIEDNIAKKQAEQEPLVEKYNKAVDNIRRNEIKIGSLEALVNQGLDGVKKLEKMKICPTCNQKVGTKCIENEKTKVNEKRKQLEPFNRKRQILRFKLEDIEKKQQVKGEAIKRWKQDKEEILKLNVEIESLIHKREKHEKNESIKKSVRRYKRALEKLKNKNFELLRKAETINFKATALGEDAEESNKIVIKYNRVVDDIEKVERDVQLERIHRQELEDIIDKNEGKIELALHHNEEIEKEHSKLLHLDDYLQYIRTVCKDEQIKQYAISANVPYLNKQTNHYLSEVGHGFYVMLDKWLDLDIKGPGIAGATYGNLSGGEARGIDLSLQMALLDFARVKAGIFPDILELDELLDSSIDSYGLERIMQIVRMKQEEDNLKIFLVSHRKEVNDVGVDRTFLIEKVNGYSNVMIQ